jgi:hypothetical protein
MKMIIYSVLLIFLTIGCTNNRLEIPEQNDPAQVIIIQYDF